MLLSWSSFESYWLTGVALSGFNSIFEVSFAVNAAISIWKSLKDDVSKRFSRLVNEYVDSEIVSKLELPPESDTVNELRESGQQKLTRLGKFIRIAKWTAISMTLLSACLMLFSALHSQYDVTRLSGTLLSFLVLGTTSLSIFAIERASIFLMNRFKTQCENTIMHCKDAKQAKEASGDVEKILSSMSLDDLKRIVEKKENN
jgi:hypothetical protein